MSGQILWRFAIAGVTLAGSRSAAQQVVGPPESSGETPISQPEAGEPEAEHPWAVDDRNLRNEYQRIEERTGRIEAELAGADVLVDLPDGHWAHEWAGEYYVGDGLGMNVRLVVAPQSGIVYTWHGCMGLYDGNHGNVTGTFDIDEDGEPDGLVIDWTLHPQTGYEWDSERYFFVRWRGADGGVARRYLAPEAQMMSLVNDLNEFPDLVMSAAKQVGVDNQGEPDYRRWDDAPVAGFPHLPEPWGRLLLKEPIFGEVLGVSEPDQSNVTRGVDQTTCRVVISAGSEVGVFVGLKAWYRGAGMGAATMTAVSVEEGRSVFEFVAFHGPGERITLPAVGERVRLAGRESDEETELQPER